METMAGSAVFIDSNILVYAAVSGSPFCRRARALLSKLRDEGGSLWITRQVLREYLAVLSRPQQFLAQPLTMDELLADISRIQQLCHVAEENAACFAELLRLLEQIEVRGKQVHDANIVATMNVYGIRTLVTHNVADFTRFQGMITILPLT